MLADQGVRPGATMDARLVEGSVSLDGQLLPAGVAQHLFVTAVDEELTPARGRSPGLSLRHSARAAVPLRRGRGSRRLRHRLVLAPQGTDRVALRAGLAAALAGAGRDSPEVSVQVVAELPRDPDSGKLRRFVPLT